MNNLKFRICCKCGTKWNVSAFDTAGKRYVCPRCQYAEMRQNRKDGQTSRHKM